MILGDARRGCDAARTTVHRSQASHCSTGQHCSNTVATDACDTLFSYGSSASVPIFTNNEIAHFSCILKWCNLVRRVTSKSMTHYRINIKSKK